MVEKSAREESALHFGVFDLDLETGELRKSGVLLHLPPQPFKILSLLASHPRQLVTREEIQQQIWGSETFVDFEQGLNFAIKKIRDALGDDAETPRYIETLPRRGYRFIAPVETRRHAVLQDETFQRNGSTAPETAGTQEASPPTPASTPQQIATGHYPGRAVTALAQGVEEEQRARLRGRRLAALGLGLAGVVVGLAVLMGLNVAGIRDRALRTLGAVREPPLQIQSIAVLPLENLSRDPDQEYFADGMTDALITDLGKIGALRVISRHSVMGYKGSKKPLPEIGRELNVDAVVEGTVQQSGGRVRITTQLLHAASDRHLWAESYERDVRDVLTLQGEVTRAIAKEIKIKVTPQEQARLAPAVPVDPEAHEFYLKGNDWLRRGDRQKALEYFQQAIQKDASFARAYLGVAKVYNSLGNSVDLPSVEAFAKAKEYARRALELDESLDEAHVALGYALYSGDWDWLGAGREIRHALEINPNSESARDRYSGYLTLLDRRDEAIAEARRLQEISPLEISPLAWPYLRLAWVYYLVRRNDEALAQCAQYQKAVQGASDPLLHLFLGWVYRERGMYKEAIAELQQAPDGPIRLGHIGNAYARAGNKVEARKALQKLIQLSGQKVGTYEVALVYAGLGEKDRAFVWLEKAYQVHDKGLTFLKVDPTLDPLRSDARFQNLLRRMNFPQ